MLLGNIVIMRWNDIALHMLDLAKAEGLSYEIIDGYEIDIQRPDRHACTKCKRYDCLHQYYPDVANAHNIIFLHYLRARRTAKDIARVANYRYNFSRVTNVQPDGMAVAFDPRDNM